MSAEGSSIHFPSHSLEQYGVTREVESVNVHYVRGTKAEKDVEATNQKVLKLLSKFCSSKDEEQKMRRAARLDKLLGKHDIEVKFTRRSDSQRFRVAKGFSKPRKEKGKSRKSPGATRTGKSDRSMEAKKGRQQAKRARQANRTAASSSMGLHEPLNPAEREDERRLSEWAREKLSGSENRMFMQMLQDRVNSSEHKNLERARLEVLQDVHENKMYGRPIDWKPPIHNLSMKDRAVVHKRAVRDAEYFGSFEAAYGYHEEKLATELYPPPSTY